LKAYSPSTIQTYRNEFLQLLKLLKQKPVSELTSGELRRYFLYCFEKLKLTENTLHSRINAIKFYFEQVLGRERFFWEIPRPRKKTELPRMFTQEEVTAIINSTVNKKHKTMLMLAYSAGLRVSEVVSLKTADIDSTRMTITIRQAKVALGRELWNVVDVIVGFGLIASIFIQQKPAKFEP
jgi:integrase/recombinase XerD